MSALWAKIWQPVWTDLWCAPFAPSTYQAFQVSDDGGVLFQVDDGASGHENFEVRE
jgi:hypothetical protein